MINDAMKLCYHRPGQTLIVPPMLLTVRNEVKLSKLSKLLTSIVDNFGIKLLEGSMIILIILIILGLLDHRVNLDILLFYSLPGDIFAANPFQPM